MRGYPNIVKKSISNESEFINHIIETDRSIEAQLTDLESLLERRGDATLELSQLRQLRRSCERLKELLGRSEEMPVSRPAASR
jgi:DNA repair exonuclease SbcCD ATPase subunit